MFAGRVLHRPSTSGSTLAERSLAARRSCLCERSSAAATCRYVGFNVRLALRPSLPYARVKPPSTVQTALAISLGRVRALRAAFFGTRLQPRKARWNGDARRALGGQ